MKGPVRFSVVIVLVWTLTLAPISIRAQQVSVVAEVCNQAGVCAPIEPATALIILGLAQIAKELTKDDPFGENNEIVKAVRNIVADITHGPGPNNDLVKIFDNVAKDIRCGPGPSNDIVKFLGSLGIKIETRKCN